MEAKPSSGIRFFGAEPEVGNPADEGLLCSATDAGSNKLESTLSLFIPTNSNKMFIYYSKTFTTSHVGRRIIMVVCDQCNCEYCYELTRVGTGSSSAVYGIGSSKAAHEATSLSEQDLLKRLASDAELVPCPQCHWINEELVERYRARQYRELGNFAILCAVIGCILSLIVGWFISIGNQGDRWLLPYCLYFAPATIIAFLTLVLITCSVLRKRIQPNSTFPNEPVVPPGTPPALFVDETTNTIRLAKAVTPPSDGILPYQVGRHHLPPVCCKCLQQSTDGHEHSLVLTGTIKLSVPLCSDCDDNIKHEFRKRYWKLFLPGLILAASFVAYAAYEGAEIAGCVCGGLFLLAVSLVVASISADRRTTPVKLIGSDFERGVFRLKFQNPAYVVAVVPVLELPPNK